MKAVDYNEVLPIKMWLEPDSLDDKAKTQVSNLANLPFAFHHVALMPDAHGGYGMPIGGILAVRDVIIPNAVGVDIGCGMTAVKLPLKSKDLDKSALKYILNMIRNAIPVGYKKHKHGDDALMPEFPKYGPTTDHMPIVLREFNNASKSLGTLGGGNHFIEVQEDVIDGDIYIMLHSGSRNLGKQVADHYNKIAIEENEKYNVKIPPEWEMAFFDTDSVIGQDYGREMKYCIAFAKKSRSVMLRKIIEIFYSMLDLKEDHEHPIDCCHNFAQYEHHFGEDVIVHRKGATLARNGTTAIIPGSQGSASFIVTGKGNKDSFESCSHGAGRAMGRNQAKRELNLEMEIDHLDKLGVIHSVRSVKDLDEATGAYKSIETVMDNQKDLVGIKVRLKALAVIKG
jgi:tRNA-splicing ligase RtcB